MEGGEPAAGGRSLSWRRISWVWIWAQRQAEAGGRDFPELCDRGVGVYGRGSRKYLLWELHVWCGYRGEAGSGGYRYGCIPAAGRGCQRADGAVSGGTFWGDSDRAGGGAVWFWERILLWTVLDAGLRRPDVLFRALWVRAVLGGLPGGANHVHSISGSV